jgi:Ca2+-binding RTX toxin-like protein
VPPDALVLVPAGDGTVARLIVNAAPELPAAAEVVAVASGFAYQVAATDPEGQPLSYGLGGPDAGLFALDPVSGQLSFTGAAPSGLSAFGLTVSVGDGVRSSEQALQVTLASGALLPSTPGDDALSGGPEADLFETGTGADVNEGLGGDDLFVLSPTEVDAIWEASRFTYAEQVTFSSGNRISVGLEGRVRVDDTFLGGDGADGVLGSDLGEALLLFDPNYSGTNSALASFNARIIALESFAMGGGDDIVDLTSSVSQQGFVADATIDGGDGDDYLFGGAGNDTITGGTGRDGIIGWRGDDRLTGGEAGGSGDGEQDNFLFAAASGGGTDVITDFEDGIDRIFVVGYGAQSYAAALSSGALSVDTADGTPRVTLTDGLRTTEVLLEGFSGTLDASDFVVLDDAPAPDSDPGDNPTVIAGNDSDEQLQGTAQNDTFTGSEGADIFEGFDGNDVFALSDTGIDGIWEASRFTYAEQVTFSNGNRISVSLTDKVQVDDTFLGGDGFDAIRGTDLGEAILLFDPNYSGTNSILANFNARIIGVEEIDLGGGDDVVDLTSGVSQQGFIADIRLLGGAGDDYLLSGAGHDTLIGGTGSDGLIGWKGDDVLTGGGADGLGDGVRDNFLFAAGSGGGRDVITDFEDGIDRIFVVGYGVGDLATAEAGGVLEIATGATDTELTLSDGSLETRITLEGITAPLTGDDFVFLI